MFPRRRLVAVCGSGSGDENLLTLARDTGRLLARAGAIILCGGLGGIMSAVAEGARENGGLTVGILPGTNPDEANPYIDIPLATGLGQARNAVLTRAGDAIIALPGGPGTLSEIGFGLKMNKRVIGLTAWAQIPGVIPAQTSAEAVALALDLSELPA